MKTLLTTFICCLVLSGCSQKYQRTSSLASINIVDQNDMSETISTKERLNQFEQTNFCQTQPYKKVLRVYERNNQGAVNAVITTYYDNGQIKQYLEVSDGRACGKYSEWYSSGVKKLEGYLVGGKAELEEDAANSWIFDDLCQAWDKNGSLEASFFYEKGSLEKTAYYFHKNGSVWKEIPYSKNKVDGVLRVFLNNGELFEEAHFSNGLQDGPAYRYWEQKEEKLASCECWEKGRLVKGRYYDSSEKLLSQIDGGNGFKTLFSENSVSAYHQYQDGQLEGIIKNLDEAGAVIHTYHIKNGLKHGEEIEYDYVEGALKPQLSIEWLEGQISGIVKTWYPTGQLESQREIHQNQKNGLCLAWYRDGNLMMIEEYEKDKLTKGEYFKKGDKTPVSEVYSGEGVATLFDSDGGLLYSVNYNNGSPQD